MLEPFLSSNRCTGQALPDRVSVFTDQSSKFPDIDPNFSSPDDLKKHHDDWDFTKTWEEMQKLPASGRVRAIGGAYLPLPP